MFSIFDLKPAIPEMFVLCMAVIILLVDVFIKHRRSLISYVLAQITLLIAAVLTWMQYGQPSIIAFEGAFILDSLSIILKLFIYLSALIVFIYARNYLPKIEVPSGEFYGLAVFSVLGMMVIVSAHHFITLFLGLELFSLPIYAMIALQRHASAGIEAGIKYFVIGSIASGMLLYGMSIVYGATSHMELTQIAQVVDQFNTHPNILLLFGLAFIAVGLVFKLGAAPFHLWVPDVYEGASTPVVLFLGTASKIAALGLVFRLLTEALGGLIQHWQQLLMIAALLSMALGNLAAIAQTNIKRMLAYSSIAHMGYMLLGLLTGTPQGYAAALFYMITYALMTLGAFGLVLIMNNAGYSSSRINDLRGLNSRNPWLALMMLLTMFSLAGVPPIVGFMAKVAILEALIGVHQVWLAAVALLFAIIGAYYYIRVVKVMYFEAPVEEKSIICGKDMKAVLSFNGISLLLLGIVPGFLFSLCQDVFINAI